MGEGERVRGKGRGSAKQLRRRLTRGCKSPNCLQLDQRLFRAHRPIRRDANDEGPTDFLTSGLSTTQHVLISVKATEDVIFFACGAKEGSPPCGCSAGRDVLNDT
mgnify:CR=1 FL=1